MEIKKDKIDFVLPWVDSNDPQWQMERDKYSGKKKVTEDANSNSKHRFRDMETLRFVLRGIENNCPWYNKIYIITTGHYPTWLNIKHPKIELITHQNLYFDKSHLPVFNSSSIEMNLANIKGLSDKLVYLNDDSLIMRPLEITRFFVDNKPVDFFEHGWVPRNKVFKVFREMGTWIYSLKNNIGLINNKFYPYKITDKYLFHPSYSTTAKISNFLFKHLYKRIFWLEHWHHPQAFLRSTLEKVHREFETEMDICSSNRFRTNDDLTQYLYRYWHLVNGDFIPYMYNDGYVMTIKSNKAFDKEIYRINNKKYNFVCFNDSADLNDEEFDKIKMKLTKHLYGLFPDRASFEI